jgi:hypothetical protein
MKYVLTVQRTYDTEVVIDAPPGVTPSQLLKYPARHLCRCFSDFEMVEDTILDVREYEDEEHLDVMDYIP